MPRSARKPLAIKELAVGLLGRREEIEPGLSSRLLGDVEAAICQREDLVVEYELDQVEDSKCSVAAAYLRRKHPPRIVLSPTMSFRRRKFSLAHEFAHFLIDRDTVLADLLFVEPDRGEALEEDICDAFAAMLLVGDDLVDSALNGADATAAAVVRLFGASRASREACAVAMAQRLTVPGYVIIAAMEADDDGEEAVVARFAARANGVLPIRRGTPQPGTLLEQARRQGTARGEDQLRLPSGAKTEAVPRRRSL